MLIIELLNKEVRGYEVEEFQIKENSICYVKRGCKSFSSIVDENFKKIKRIYADGVLVYESNRDLN